LCVLEPIALSFLKWLGYHANRLEYTTIRTTVECCCNNSHGYTII
jgi:hypothetical protein